MILRRLPCSLRSKSSQAYDQRLEKSSSIRWQRMASRMPHSWPVPSGGLDGLDQGIVGVVPTEQHGAAHPRITGQAPVSTLPSSNETGPGKSRLVDLGETC